MAKMKKIPIHVFPCDVFPRNLYIVKQPPKGWLEKHFEDISGVKLKEYTSDEANAVTYHNVTNIDTMKYGILVVLLGKDMTISDCAHEATHFAMDMYATMGEEINVEHQEVMAYLIGYATDCIYQVAFNKYKPMMNGSHEI